MKTYEEAIWQLAMSKAHSYYGGDVMPRAEGADTVAWIFDVTLDKISKDIEQVYAEACKKALHG